MSDHLYGRRPTDFAVGQRVALHPATDTWMRGDRYGTVIKIGREMVQLRLDSSRYLGISPHNIRIIDTGESS